MYVHNVIHGRKLWKRFIPGYFGIWIESMGFKERDFAFSGKTLFSNIGLGNTMIFKVYWYLEENFRTSREIMSSRK